MVNLPWMELANDDLGIAEIPGPDSNPKIMQWMQDLGLRGYTDDSIPWCAGYLAHLMQECGAEQTLAAVPNKLWARDWLLVPEKCKPQYGAILVFSRGGGGHVALYVSEDENYYHIIGGNQGDAVSLIRHPKSNLLGARWPVEYISLKDKTGPVINHNFSTD